MKNYIYSILVVFISANLCFSQQTYSRVKVYGDHAELQQLGAMGLPVDHGEYKKNTYFITDLSSTDIAKIEAAGYSYEILIDDVQQYYVAHSDDVVQKESTCSGQGGTAYNPTTPSNFQLGSMGGYYTYQEFLDELDSMASKYPNLISSRAQIDTYTTYEGNPIYWVRLSDNPNTDEAEEEVLYTALHHAREPASLSQTIYYMWYVLENYGTDPEITYLVDNTEMYFIPMINPDGYIENETNFPNGGGMHRKNKNPVSGGSNNIGVDLNRNYAYHWDQSGTSNDPNNDTWPGTGSFSEVETQAMKWFVENHNIKFAFNAHTHGNLLLFPIGWANNEFAPHHDYYTAYTTHMVKYNGYDNMKSSGLYPAAGDSDDWMYIDDIGVNGKDTIFAMTPEVSSEGTSNDFWPPSSSIEDICKVNIHMNKTLSHMPHIFGVAKDLELSKVNANTGYFNYELQRLGLTDGPMTVNMTAIAGIQSLASGNTHNLNLTQLIEDSIQYTLNAGIQFGDDIIYTLEVDNGTYTSKDTIYKTYGLGTVVFSDDCSTADNWTGDWSFTNEDFVSPNNCITDSPFVDYSNGNSSKCELVQTFDLSNATYAYVNFWAKWDIENNYDFVQFMISTDGGTTWSPLCGNYTNTGTSNQDVDQPLYDGVQDTWVYEEIDLTDYLGSQNVSFKFRLQSDQYVNQDGFYFDDFSVSTDAVNDAGVTDLVTEDILLYPNPSNSYINLRVSNNVDIQKIEVKNHLGQLVKVIQPTTNQVQIKVKDLAEGIYLATIHSKSFPAISKRFTVVK